MDDLAMIPYFVHEGEMARAERTNKRLWVLLVILIIALVGSNLAWIIYENQFETVTTRIEQQIDTGEGTAVISGTGDAINGEDKTGNHD